MTRIVTGLDIETTGLEQSQGHRIVEIAALLYDLDTRALRGKWVQRFNPQRPIDPGAQAVHGIRFEDVSGCPTWEQGAPMMSRIMQNSKLLVAHNGAHFDFPFIGMELARVGVTVPNVECLDTMVEGRWATPFGKSPNLGELCFACGVPYDKSKAHAAEYDVSVMMECFFHAYGKGFYKLPESLTIKETGNAVVPVVLSAPLSA